jgi:6-pyruvoyl-tetrahydropterin synthase
VSAPTACSLTRRLTLHGRHRYESGGPTGDHGHLYRIDVTVRGTVDDQCGAIIDLDTFDRILDQQLLIVLGGAHLNEVVPEFASGARPPTCEALAAWCWRQVAPRLPAHVHLARVRVAEDDTLWADCTGSATDVEMT